MAVSRRSVRWIVWSVITLYFTMMVIGIVLQFQTGQTMLDLGLPFIITMTILISTWPILGAVIVLRYPSHPVGWLLLLTLLVWAKDNFSFGYATYGLALSTGSLPALNLVLVTSTWDGNSFGLLAFTLLLLLFPTGRPISPRWNKVAWVAFIGLAGYLTLSMFAPSDDLAVGLPNPLSVDSSLWTALRPLRSISLSIVAFALLLSVLSSILRLRHARGDERQQMKWFIFAACLFPLSIPFASYATIVGLVGSWLTIGIAIQATIVAVIGMATALAILKYRLYDIDIIIHRTLIYGALTLLLALVYFASVVLLQRAFRALTGQDSPLVIVISTLVIAALFTPLRRWVQNIIDQRFYRRKYDAQQALATFAATARDEVELEQLTAELLSVVQETMQPEQAGLWLVSMKTEKS